MTPRPHLTLVRRKPIISEREHDLPPLWDGHPVQWEPWRREPTAFMCELDDAGQSEAVPSVCTRCGTIQTFDIIATGRVLSSTVGPSGRQRDGTPLAHLTAVRCADCDRDVVHDLTADQTWDLDPEDYADTGSWDDA